ncbi:EAL domain-containing protein [Salicola sp. Rm-C-2C1-2]|uniref:putative bifunctional diguanylate cyclase/phosphodiesterase n=1 Tax=Salicola sp. Rm-C-2C1-2 TaxID=3141321 RepID=UPI0032E4AE07
MALESLPAWLTLTVAIIAVIVTLALIAVTAVLSFYLVHSRREKSEREITLRKFSSAVMNSGAMILITDANGSIEFVNDRFCQLTGFSRDDVLSHSVAMLSATMNLSGTETGVLTNFLDCLQPHWKGELLCRTNASTPLWTAVTTSSVLNDDAKPVNYIVSAVDITELKLAHERMEQLALFDSLTNLANRRLFQDRLEQALQSVGRGQSRIALLFLDLDQFKQVNDSQGHDAGDMLLLTVADRLKSCVRAQDTVARLGGDEFTILLHDVSDTKDLTMIAENILSSLKAPIRLKGQEVLVSTSIGITSAPADGDSPDTLMKNADLALYRAKDKGRDQYDFYTESLNNRAEQLMTLERELRHGLRREEFFLLFQPQVDLHTGDITAMEALVRWQHPERGELLPYEFIPVAEDTGLIMPLGNWVLQQACMQIKLLHQLLGRGVRVAINVSARQFRDPGLEHVIDFALRTSGLEARFLEIDIREVMLSEEPQVARDQLTRIRRTGVTITLDDFGTGYSSLRQLRSLPVDMLKIGQTFVKEIPEDGPNTDIATAIIGIAQQMEKQVVAEGVETEQQEYFLRMHGCSLVQGYRYATPMTFDELYRYFSSDNERELKA